MSVNAVHNIDNKFHINRSIIVTLLQVAYKRSQKTDGLLFFREDVFAGDEVRDFISFRSKNFCERKE